ncbi:MAG TPA: GTP-binding protein [Patescibacteria group bacterium]|nr:GTP-binding protein [Patescibacteria group bacterium]
MKVLAILGTLGSGKTTLINRLLAGSLVRQQRTLVVVNDVGAVNVDAERIKTVGEIRPLTAGCIGCSDLPAFRQVLAEAQEGQAAELVIIEPTGIADGREIRQAVSEAELQPVCVALLDIKHFGRNRALNTLPGQLAAADEIWLSWLPAGETVVADEALAYAGSCAPGILVRPIPSDAAALDDAALRLFTASGGRAFPCPGHHHDHHHEHNHGVVPYTFPLRGDCRFDDLVVALAPYADCLLRAKGVVAGRNFDLVQGDLALGESSGKEAFGNFIASRPIPDSAFTAIIRDEPAADGRSKKERMRSFGGASLQDTLQAIAWQLEQYPPVLTPLGQVRADCEADVAYQLAKRPGVPADVWRQALGRYLKWRLAAAALLEPQREDQSYQRRRLGAVLAWHAQTYGGDLPAELMEEIIVLKPAHLCLQGLAAAESFGFNDELAEERPELIAAVLAFGRQREGLAPVRIRAVLAHCLQLSAGRPNWQQRWQRLADQYCGD